MSDTFTSTESNVTENSDEKERLRREASRGVFVSVMIAILLNFIGAFMFYIKVRESLVVINYGFILGSVIGFMLDQAIGKDEGCKDEGCKDAMASKGFSYTFSSLIGGNFMRYIYIVTVFLDLFISNPLQDILKTQVAKVGVIRVLKQDHRMRIGANSKDEPKIIKNKWLKKYDSFVAMNYPSILQSIVAFVTFNAYTNQTRFAWAYPNIDLSRELRIPPGIMLSTAIAGVLYLNFHTIMDYIRSSHWFYVRYVLAILGLLYGLNQTDSIEAPVADEYDKEYTKSIAIYLYDRFIFLIELLPNINKLYIFTKGSKETLDIIEANTAYYNEQLYQLFNGYKHSLNEIKLQHNTYYNILNG